MRQRSGATEKFAVVDNLIGPENHPEPLDEQDQETVIREFEKISSQYHVKWTMIIGGGVVFLAFFFLYAAWRQHVEPFGVVRPRIAPQPKPMYGGTTCA